MRCQAAQAAAAFSITIQPCRLSASVQGLPVQTTNPAKAYPPPLGLAAHLDVGLQQQLLQHMLPGRKAGLALHRVPSSQDPHSLALRVGAVELPVPHIARPGVLWIRDLQARCISVGGYAAGSMGLLD